MMSDDFGGASAPVDVDFEVLDRFLLSTTVRVSDAQRPPRTITRDFSLRTFAELSLAGPTARTGEVGLAFPVTEFVAGAGRPPYTWKTNSHLPAGLYSSASGSQTKFYSIAGTPARREVVKVELLVTDDLGVRRTHTVTLYVKDKLAWVTPSQLPAARGARPYAMKVACKGGVPPYAFGLTSGRGELPPGLSLAPSKNTSEPVIGFAGKPGGSGTYGFSIRVTDHLGATADREFALTVAPSGHALLFNATPELAGGSFSSAEPGNLVGLSFGVTNDSTAAMLLQKQKLLIAGSGDNTRHLAGVLIYEDRGVRGVLEPGIDYVVSGPNPCPTMRPKAIRTSVTDSGSRLLVEWICSCVAHPVRLSYRAGIRSIDCASGLVRDRQRRRSESDHDGDQRTRARAAVPDLIAPLADIGVSLAGLSLQILFGSDRELIVFVPNDAPAGPSSLIVRLGTRELRPRKVTLL